MTSLGRVLIACVVVAGTVGVTAGVASGAAVVLKDEDVACFTDPGDIPGAPGFPLPKATVVITPEGGANLSCRGQLPDGFSLSETFQGDVPCRDPSGTVVTGHIVATKSGKVTMTCNFPAGNL
jgi:hypothetical protein